MTKKIEVSINEFRGWVTLAQPLNMEQVFAIEDAQDAATELEPSAFLTKVGELQGTNEGKVSWSSRMDKHFIGAICKCVEEWHLEGFPEKVHPENFPMTPRKASNDLVSLLFGELTKIYQGEAVIPNGS